MKSLPFEAKISFFVVQWIRKSKDTRALEPNKPSIDDKYKSEREIELTRIAYVAVYVCVCVSMLLLMSLSLRLSNVVSLCVKILSTQRLLYSIVAIVEAILRCGAWAKVARDVMHLKYYRSTTI